MERREKLKLGVVVGKIRGRSSTPPPTWRLEFPSSQQNAKIKNTFQHEFLNFSTSTLSARNLCAKLWEIHSHCPSHQPASAWGLRRRVQASVDRNGSALPSVSPASRRSLMEVRPDNNVNHISSLDSNKGKIGIGESSCIPKSSRELVKVLNRIWCLEEQHASNIAIAKAMKMELDLSHAQIKELLQEKKMNKLEMDNIMKHITEDKLVRKNKEHDMIKGVVQSVKEEIEDERRLRKHSESLHQKLTRELSEVKTLFRGTLNDLERERKERILLENLFDDFAKGVRGYEHEETHSIVDKLRVDIETFLRTKRSIDSKKYSTSSTKEFKEIYPCLNSLDSFQLKETINSPHNAAEQDPIGSDIFEQKRTNEKGPNKLNYRLHNSNAKEIHKEKKRNKNSVSKQVLSKETPKEYRHMHKNMVKNMSCEMGGSNTTLLNAPMVSNVFETIQGPQESDRTRTKRIHSVHNHKVDNIVGNSSMSSEGDKVYPESFCRENSCVCSTVTVNASPVKQWKTTLITPDFNKSQTHYKLSKGVKDSTFMAKLVEARLEGHNSRSFL